MIRKMAASQAHLMVETVDKLEPDDAYRLISTSKRPLVFKNMIDKWKSRQWTVDFFCKTFANLTTTYKVCPLANDSDGDNKPNNSLMETDSIYVEGRIADFITWLNEDFAKSHPLKSFSRDHFSVYIDYKYMKDIFEENSEIFTDVDWGALGVHGKDGKDSTLWIGSKQAFTPLHKDTYGFNLVGQLSGKKLWTMYDPQDSENLYPTRIPYEESSIFSEVNFKNPDLIKHPLFTNAKKYEAMLNGGDVLFVPKHWWHFVENIEPSISVNTWVEKESDHADRLKEAVVRLLLCSLKGSEDCSTKSWLNPNEVAHPQETNLGYIKQAAANMLTNLTELDKDTKDQLLKRFETTDLFVNTVASDKVVTTIVQELMSKVFL